MMTNTIRRKGDEAEESKERIERKGLKGNTLKEWNGKEMTRVENT